VSLKPSAQKVQDALAARGFTNEILELAQTTRTAADAAAALGCDVGQIVKSLVFRARNSGRAVLVVASGTNRVDLARLAALLGEAVDKADAQGNMSVSNQAAPTADASQYGGGNQIRVVGSRTYVQQNGVWIDTAFDPSRMTTTKITFLSDAYFAFLVAHPELGPALALGDAVIVAVGSEFYEVVPG
jgi:hypothetical protein